MWYLKNHNRDTQVYVNTVSNSSQLTEMECNTPHPLQWSSHSNYKAEQCTTREPTQDCIKLGVDRKTGMMPHMFIFYQEDYSCWTTKPVLRYCLSTFSFIFRKTDAKCCKGLKIFSRARRPVSGAAPSRSTYTQTAQLKVKIIKMGKRQ